MSESSVHADTGKPSAAVAAAMQVLHQPCLDGWAKTSSKWQTMHGVEAHYDRAAQIVAAVRPLILAELLDLAVEATTRPGNP